MLADAGKLKLRYDWMFGQVMALNHIRCFSQNIAVEGTFSVLISAAGLAFGNSLRFCLQQNKLA